MWLPCDEGKTAGRWTVVRGPGAGLTVPEGRFVEGRERGYSAGCGEGWSGENASFWVGRRNTAGLRPPSLKRACLRGGTVAGIRNVGDKRLPLLI